MVAILNAGVLVALRKWVELLGPLVASDDSAKSLLVGICNSMAKLPVTIDHIKQSRIGHALRELSSGPREVSEASSAAREAFKKHLNVLSSASGGRVALSTGAGVASGAAATGALQQQGSAEELADEGAGEDSEGVATGGEGGGDSDGTPPNVGAHDAEHAQHASADANGAAQGVDKGGEEVESTDATGHGTLCSALGPWRACMHSCMQEFLDSFV